MSINYSNKNVAALCMLPSILLGVLLAPDQPLLMWLMWLVWTVLNLVVCGVFYQVVVLMRLPIRIPVGVRYIACLFSQAAFWYLLISYNAASTLC